MVRRQLNLEKTVAFAKAHDLYTPYDRYQRLLVLFGTQAQVKIIALNLGSGQGGRATLLGTTYTLSADGVQVGSVNVPGGAFNATFTVDATRIPQGWHLLEIGGGVDGEVGQPMWAFVKHDAVIGEQPFTPVSRGQYARSMSVTSDQEVWVKLPGRYNPVPKPITVPRTYVTPDPRLLRSGLNCEALIPVRFGDVHRPNVNVDGILSSFDYQDYFWSSLHAQKPIVACLDGPRGVGTACMITHLALSTAAPNGVPRNVTYFSDPWRIGKITESGTITTLVGYRHRNGIIPHWEDDVTPSLELIGDWSEVPAERRGFWEIWGFAWDERTVTINEGAAPIPSENNERPHILGPTLFVADTQRNRICKVVFSAVAHGVPPKVTEFITGLADPWEVVYADRLIYITERKAHRISVYDADTGAFVKVLVQGVVPSVGTFTAVAGNNLINLSTTTPLPLNSVVYLGPAQDQVFPDGVATHTAYHVVSVSGNSARLSTYPGSVPPVLPRTNGSGVVYQPLAYVDANREVNMVASTTMLQASPCVAPEGLFLQDGWLYFSSKAQAQVRRVRLNGTGLEVVRPIHIDGNSKFAKLALSDGTFGPRGSTFTWTWSNAHFGGPEMYDNTGRSIQPWWNLQTGGTGDWTTHAGYGTAGAIGQGRMITANMLEGLTRVTKSQAGDPVETAAVTAGRAEYLDRHLNLVHGPDGFGFYGLPLPWGLSSNIDAYLTFAGHVRGA